jgi:metal-responsive CopG/Arc/MetJ family transcriptional regulator
MIKTTVNLPDGLKLAVEREAKRRGISQAELIRQTIAAALDSRRPQFGILDVEPFAHRVDELMEGFGER